ncbi:hypothetical protein BV898_02249 [Hypsibius exemplaris]|uniref:STX17-like N-terminal domain-containing protein n=1 Tax=Hypsibius exemplaris TaxID=2072580 RepID=A0A1W0X9G0_HYPEX|nr:hypothetical protein BV898_02249 [Hypsibius exemplaris]
MQMHFENDIPLLKQKDILSPLYRTKRKQYAMLLDRFHQYSIKPHLESLREHEKELDRLKMRNDRRNILQTRTEACRTLQQIRVDLVDLGRIKEQALCPEDQDYFEERGVPMRVELLRAAASLLEKHPDVKKPAQEQDDILLDEEEKSQGYALAAEELDRERDRVADRQDLLLRVETIHTDVEHVAGIMDEFWTLIEAQGRQVSTIEGNIAEADNSTIQGAKELAIAAKYKTAMYPLAGAVIGGVIAGPIGMLSGLKLAGLVSAAAGTFIGWKGGNVWRRRALLTLPFEMLPGDTEVELTPRDASDIPVENPNKKGD